jgi:Fe-S cluster assembly iron-binding protein IscA
MIKLTDNALLRLRELRKKNDKRFVRLDVKGGGCAGFEYQWSYAEAKSTCGCGTSFSVGM